MLKNNTIYKTPDDYYVKVFEVRGEHVYATDRYTNLIDVKSSYFVFHYHIDQTKNWVEVDEDGNEKRWKPEGGERYYHIGYNLKTKRATWLGDRFDKMHYKACNCFPTLEKAQEAADAIKKLLKTL